MRYIHARHKNPIQIHFSDTNICERVGIGRVTHTIAGLIGACRSISKLFVIAMLRTNEILVVLKVINTSEVIVQVLNVILFSSR